MLKFIPFVAAIFMAHSAFASDITISDSWAAASLGKSPMSAAYMTISNKGTSKRILKQVTGDVSNVIEMHTHTTSHDGMMQMRKIEDVIIQPGKNTSFEPGALHLMLIGLKQALKAGESINMTLHFANGERFDTTFEIRQR